MSGIANWQAQIRIDIEDLKKRIKVAEGEINNFTNEDRKVKLDIDTKTLESAIQKLDKMLDSLGKGTGDFKQFENLSKELSSIVSEVQSLSKAFGKVDDSGTKTLLSSIQNIDKSLSELSQNILNVNKNMSNMGGNTSGAAKQVENISNAYQDAAKEAEKLADAQSKIGQKTNISSANETPKSIENTTNAITEQTNALKELILSWVEAQKVMSKSGSASTEKIAVGNLSNGFVSNSNFTGDLNSISDKLIRNIIENATETVDTIIHSHPDYNLAAFSPEDIASSIIRFATGIQNQIIVGMDEISIMDVSKIKDFNPLEIKNKIEQELSSLINSYIKNQLQSIDNLQTIFVNNFSGGLDEWSTFTDLISENTNSDFLKNVIQKYKDSISDALINMGSDYKFSNSDELGTFIYENIIKKYVRSYVSNSNPDINQSEYDALQKEALENFKKEFSAIYDKAFSIKDYESLLTDNEIQPIVKEAFSNILKTFGLKYEDVIKTISVEQLKTSSISPTKETLPDKDVSASVESATNSIKEENNVLEQNTQKVKENTQAKEQNANVNLNKYDKRLDSYQGKINKYNTTIKRFEDGGWTSSTYLENVQAVRDAVKQYETLLNELKGKDASLVTSEDISKLDKYEKKIKDTIATVTNMSAAEKGYNFVSGQKELDKIHKLLNENSKMSSEAKAKIKAYYAEIESGNPSMSLDKIHGEILKIYNAEVEAGRAGRTLWDTLKNSGFHQIAAQMAGMIGVYDIINIFKQGANTLKEFDDGLTKISYTMDMTKSQLDNLGNSVLDMASDMKSSIDDAMQVAQIYANMQTSAEEIQKLSEPTLILSNLSGFDASTVADDIQAASQQFDIAAEDSMHIADVYDYISRNIQVDYSKGLESMAEGLQVAGSTAKQAGLDLEQTTAIIAKAVEKTRLEGSQVGNGLKTILTRLSKVGELSDEVDNETLSKASESLHQIGIEVYNVDGSYRQFDVIMGELAEKWDGLTDAEKSNLSYNIAATRQTNLLSAILSNFSDSMQLAEEATNANGSAIENQQKYMESFSGHLQYLETEAKIAWLNILDSETLKDGVDLLTGLVKVVGKLVDTFGLLGTTAGIGGIVAGIKNVGIDTLVAY